MPPSKVVQYNIIWSVSCTVQCLYYKSVSNHFCSILPSFNSKIKIIIWMYGTLQHPATPHWKLIQWLSGPSPSLSATTDRPAVTRPDSNDVRTRSIYSTNSSRWHKCKSGWSLKTEKIHLKWHVYLDTTHTIRHLFLTWTSLYPFTFLKT